MADATTAAAPPPLPTSKTPGWEFTDLSGLDLDAYPQSTEGDPAARECAEPVLELPDGAPTVAQVDGAVVAEPGADGGGGERPGEPLVTSLAAAMERYPDLVRERLGSLAPAEDPFVARNDESWRGGAFVYVPAGGRLEQPAQLLAIREAAGATLSYRSLIVLEEGAEAEVCEQWLEGGRDGAGGLLNTVTEIRVGPGATLRYVSAQRLDESSWVFGTQRAALERDASLDWVALGFGSGRGKVRMETRLAGKGSSAKVTGAYAGAGSQHLDFDTIQEHAAPATTSDLAFRGVLNGTATAVWRGMIKVEPRAQQTDAFQECRNLLLSKSAHADAIPGLEIEADDVRCTHAAATTQIDAEQLHYLRAHGLPEGDARGLVIEGFLESLVERIAEGPVREAVSVALQRRLDEILAAPAAAAAG